MVAYLFQPWLEYLCTLFVKFACAKSPACGHMDHEIDSANYKKGSGNEQNRWTNFSTLDLRTTVRYLPTLASIESS